MLKNMNDRIAVITIKVLPALRLFGSWKAGMPLLIASTPVSAVQPLENALRTRNIVRSWATVCIASTFSTEESEPVKNRK